MVCLHCDVAPALHILLKNLEEFVSTEPERKKAKEIHLEWKRIFSCECDETIEFDWVDLSYSSSLIHTYLVTDKTSNNMKLPLRQWMCCFSKMIQLLL